MKKRITAFLLALTMLCLTSCHQKGELTDVGFVDPNTKIEYAYCAPMGLYPLEKEEEYLTVKEGEAEVVYYSVEFENPERFLCYEEVDNLFLAYAKDIKIPTAAEFNPVSAHIYGSTNTVFIETFYADNEYIPEEFRNEDNIGETALCKEISQAFVTSEAVELNATIETMSDLFYIRLLSPDYPGLYYLVSFFGYNGRYFLRDGAANKTVYCPRNIIVRMVGEN